jgi:hypothetical protein
LTRSLRPMTGAPATPSPSCSGPSGSGRSTSAGWSPRANSRRWPSSTSGCRCRLVATGARRSCSSERRQRPRPRW